MAGHGKYHLMVRFEAGEPTSVIVSDVGKGGSILSSKWSGAERLPTPRSVVRVLSQDACRYARPGHRSNTLWEETDGRHVHSHLLPRSRPREERGLLRWQAGHKEARREDLGSATNYFYAMEADVSSPMLEL